MASTESPQLRQLPQVDQLADLVSDSRWPRTLAVAEARRILAAMRADILEGRPVDPASAPQKLRESLETLARPSLKHVINATGVVLHTNLGRAPGAPFVPVQGYSNLEYDLAVGKRGRRDTHLAGLIERLAGRPGIAVNNNAAAVLLVLNELARGGEAIVSRGELIEIGDGFRIPDIMSASGAALCEVGTTNRTRIDDYRNAINSRTRLLMRVHPSNFRMEGFTGKPPLDELAALARERNLPLYEDLGSGCIADLSAFGITEPTLAESFHAGVNLASFSGDKLLGGPQAGMIAGDGPLVERIRKNPLFRAVRVDKLITQALETTLRLALFERWDALPALHMIRTTAEEIRERAEALRRTLPELEIMEGQSLAGGGSTPEQTLPTWLLVVPGNASATERKLRAADPPVIARIENDRLVIDLRTVLPGEEAALVSALQGLSAYARSR